MRLQQVLVARKVVKDISKSYGIGENFSVGFIVDLEDFPETEKEVLIAIQSPDGYACMSIPIARRLIARLKAMGIE